ncbi:hypothetical protein HUJ04_011062 [Dendroctonus ponderosae]|nr:hypothetical protein HUJ04_011062 [Dendroctonus ponderosae]
MPVLQKYSTEELPFAARRSLEASGQKNALQILKGLSDPEDAYRIKNAISTSTLEPKETPELTKQVVANMKQEISEMEPTIIQKHQLQISHTFKMTMIDGKLFSVLKPVFNTEMWYMRCNP